MPDPAVRRAKAGDAADLAAIHRETTIWAYRYVFPADAPPPSLAELTELWHERLAADGDDLESAVFIASDSAGTPVGVAAIGVEPHLARARLLGFYVRPQTWDAGHGRALHDEVLAHVARLGTTRIDVWVLEGNERGIEWYRRHGYVRTDERLAAFPDLGIFDEGWRLDLAPPPAES